jgi:hypothetical protein
MIAPIKLPNGSYVLGRANVPAAVIAYWNSLCEQDEIYDTNERV